MSEIEGRPGLDDLVLREKGDIDIPEGAEVTFRMVPDKFTISFHDPKGKELGKLSEGDDGRISFAGHASQSAEVFFTAVIEANSEKIRQFSLAQELLRVAKCPNAHCVDGVCQEGFADDYEVFECQFCHDRKELLK